VAVSCENGNEISSFIKYVEFLTNRAKISFSRRTLLYGILVCRLVTSNNCIDFKGSDKYSALSGLVVSVLATGPKVRGFKPGRER
jgi:hypothetical protein